MEKMQGEYELRIRNLQDELQLVKGQVSQAASYSSDMQYTRWLAGDAAGYPLVPADVPYEHELPLRLPPLAADRTWTEQAKAAWTQFQRQDDRDACKREWNSKRKRKSHERNSQAAFACHFYVYY
jgi:hypothetical protein